MFINKLHKPCVGFLFCMLFAQNAYAQTTPEAQPTKPEVKTTEADKPQARTADMWIEDGTKAYKNKQYKQALEAFQKAQQLNKSTDLYYNIGRVHEALNQPKKAMEAYRKFVVTPDANIDARTDALKRLNVLKEIVASREPKKTTPEPIVEKKVVVVKPVAKPVVQPKASGPHPMTWVLLGTGVVSVGLGSYFAIQSNAAQSLAESKCRDQGSGMLCPENAQTNWDNMTQNAVIADIAFATGGALLVSSLITYIVSSGDDNPQASQMQFAPVVTSSSASIQLHTSF